MFLVKENASNLCKFFDAIIADNQISPRPKNVFTKAKCLTFSVDGFICLSSLLISTNIVNLFYKTLN